MSVRSLKWSQVNAWRLWQHCLSPRVPRQDFIKAAARICGVQAQVMSAAEMALAVRADGLAAQDVQSALWQERSLVKTWAMRATLHLVPARDLPLYVAARDIDETRNWPYFFEYYGVPKAQYEAYLAAAPQILSSQPMTREEFANAVAEQIKSPELHSLVLSKGWGTPLKPLAWRGDLCFGPSQGQNVTFVHPGKWLGSWQPLEHHPALQEILRRYLLAYGPSTPEYFARWWSLRLSRTRKLFQSLGDELEPVEVEGWQAFALRSTLEPMQDLELTGTVRLLPLFDAYVLGLGRGSELEPLLPKPFQVQVYRPQGWISAVVLVDGYIRGTWEYKTRAAQTDLKIHLFDSPQPADQKGIEAEAARLAQFLGTELSLSYE